MGCGVGTIIVKYVCVCVAVRRMNKKRRRHEEYYVACLEGNQKKKKETTFNAVYENTVFFCSNF